MPHSKFAMHVPAVLPVRSHSDVPTAETFTYFDALTVVIFAGMYDPEPVLTP
jgi:hypothetical protein